MKEIIKKSFLLGLGAASMTKIQAEKIVKELVKRNAVTIKEGSGMLKKVKKIALSESERIRKLAEKETKRLAGNLGIASKASVGNIKKKLKSMDKELSSQGKKALKMIMKELSK